MTRYWNLTGTNSVVAGCGDEPEWANLTCQTGPAAQPGTSGLPDVPVTTYTYDDYLNIATKTEAFGSAGTRTTTYTYDNADRPVGQTVTVAGTGMGTAIPETRTVYAVSTGLPTDTQTINSSGNVTADISTTYDDFGSTLTYTDAAGNVTTYGYDIDSRISSRNDGEGTVSYNYSPGGQLTSETDSQAGTFTATYNPDGNIQTETFPGSLTATYTYDATGTAISLSYDGQAWAAPLTDTVVPNAAGDWVTQSIADTATPLVSSQAYSYDNAGRLTSVQDTQAGQCTTRTYTYDADSNRTSLNTYAPGADGTCQASASIASSYAYDSADRLINTGYTYDTQGDITTTPSADAGGNGDLTATYYANDMLASQTQAGSTLSWTFDPDQNRDATQTDSSTGITYTSHYTGNSSDPAWIAGSDQSWTRYVTGLDNQLAAEVTPGGIVLELPDLNDNIMATATTNPAATGPTGINTYSEYGSPEQGTPGTYGWHGADQSSSNGLGGDYITDGRAYSALDGIYTQPASGGSASGSYAYSNPPLGDPCRTISETTWALDALHLRVIGFQMNTYYCWNTTRITYHYTWGTPFFTEFAIGWSFDGAPSYFHCFYPDFYPVSCGGNWEEMQPMFTLGLQRPSVEHFDPIIEMWEYGGWMYNGGYIVTVDGDVVQDAGW